MHLYLSNYVDILSFLEEYATFTFEMLLFTYKLQTLPERG